MRGVTDYIDADVRDPDTVLRAAAETLDFARPVAVMMLGILGNVADTDEPAQIVKRLVAALAPGSYLVINDSVVTTATRLRKNVTIDQAREMYRRFGAAHGDPVETPHGVAFLFPDPECVLRLPATAFGALRMSFTHLLLRVAARAYREHGTAWSQLDPATMVAALRSVPGIGAWIAGAAVADFSGDFSVYPYPDRTMRTYLRRAAPTTDWPGSDGQFRTRWHALAGDTVSGLTQLVLASGETHLGPARSDCSGLPLMGDLPEPVDLLDVLRTYARRRLRARQLAS